MSTSNIESWAVDLSEVTVIYPFVGLEGVFTIVGVAAWLAWHIWQARQESGEYNTEIERFGDQQSLKVAVESD